MHSGVIQYIRIVIKTALLVLFGINKCVPHDHSIQMNKKEIKPNVINAQPIADLNILPKLSTSNIY